MRRGLLIPVIVALLLLIVIVGFWGMRLIGRLLEAPPTITVEEQRSVEAQLQEALATVDILQKTATAIAVASTAVAPTTESAAPVATSAPPATLTSAQPVATTEPPASPTVGPAVTPTPEAITIVPASARASSEPACSQDSRGNPVCYPASSVIDGDMATAWRESLSKNPWIEVELPATTVVTQVAIVGGYAKIDPYDGSDRWRQNHRPRRVRVYLDDTEVGERELADAREWQAIEVQSQPARRVRLVILDSYPPLEGDRPYVAISEIRVIGH